jgi:hypothetical protein
MKTNSKLVISLTVLCVIGIFTKPAHAYIDPASGSLILQVLLGAIAIFVGLIWHKLKIFFGRLFGKKKISKKA